MLVRQMIGFTNVDIVAVKAEEAPDGVPMTFLRFRGAANGEDVTMTEIPIPPDLAVKVGESLIECGKELGGSGLEVARSMLDAERLAAEAEVASRLIVP
jgi:hypothetical protein